MKKGFTLIELLAVIVILAIISLIAVPIVINIINDSKNSSDEQSVELYLDTVEKTITKKQLSNPSFNPDRCEIQDKGDLKCYKNNELIDTVQVEMKGKMPNKGEITILNNKFNYKNIWFNNKKYYAIAILLSDADNNKEISIGDKYSYKVNDIDTFKFYVLTDPKDGKVNLIMDRNICDDGKAATVENKCLVAWNALSGNNSNGPVTAMQAVYYATKNWSNVPDMNLDYSDEGHIENNSYGYGKIETTSSGIKITKKDGTTEVEREGNQVPVISYEINKPLKARLPMLIEVNGAGCSNTSSESCPSWLTNGLEQYQNFYPNNEHISGSLYWLLSSYPNVFNLARDVFCNGRVEGDGVSSYNNGGIRPVITVPISDLE